MRLYRAEEVKTIKILLVDDQQAVRRSLAMRLELEPDVVIVGKAGDGAEAVSLAQSLRPDVILMDVRMTGMDGISAARALRAAPGCAVVILSLYDDATTRFRAKEADAAAFVAKHEAEEALLAAVRRTAFGRSEDG